MKSVAGITAAHMLHEEGKSDEAVYNTFKNISEEEFPEFISYIYENMHSANTIKQFKI